MQKTKKFLKPEDFETERLEVKFDYNVREDQTHNIFHRGAVATVKERDREDIVLSIEARGELKILDSKDNYVTDNIPIYADDPDKRVVTNEDIENNFDLYGDYFGEYHIVAENWWEIFVLIENDEDKHYVAHSVNSVNTFLDNAIEKAIQNYDEYIEYCKGGE